MNLIADSIRDACWRDLVNLTFVFGIVVKELIMGNDLGDRESNGFIFGLIDAAGHFRTLHKRLADNLIALFERALNGRVDILNGFHLGATEAAAAYVRFDKAGQS